MRDIYEMKFNHMVKKAQHQYDMEEPETVEEEEIINELDEEEREE